MLTSTHIEAARELLTEKWGQGRFHDYDNDTYCAVGALNKVRGGMTLSEIAKLSRLFSAAGALGPYATVVDWNDHSQKQEVLDGFDRVAKYMRDKGQ